MSAITYTAHVRATLMAGHTAGNSYAFDTAFMQMDTAYNSPKSQHQALDGSVESVLHRIDRTISITIGLYDSDDEDQITEFIESVAGGEEFTIDVNGTSSTPDSPITVKLKGNANQPQRHGPRTYSLPMTLFKV